ncbi:MAG TPA: CvpA family protein [Anaerolineales bacterium]
MMSLVYVFWMYVLVFAIIGMLRGWAKELLVSFSVILALALNHLLRRYVPIIADLPDDSVSLFWIQGLILGALVFFGYQTVALVPHLQSKATRERLQDALFGAILGGINGYLIAGTILFYVVQTNYQIAPAVVSAPADPGTAAAVQSLLTFMPPHLLGEPGIYFAVILAFIFVIVVYI